MASTCRVSQNLPGVRGARFRQLSRFAELGPRATVKIGSLFEVGL